MAAVELGDASGPAFWLDRLGWAATLVAFAAVPLVAISGGDYPLSLPKLTLLWWCAIVGLAGWFGSWILTRDRLPRVRLGIPVAVLGAVTILATVVGVSADRSLFGINGRYGGLIPMLAMIVVAFCVVAFSWARPSRLWSLVAAGAASGLVGALAVVVMRLGVSIGPATVTSTLSRPNGLLGNPDFSGAHIALMLPLLVAGRRRLLAGWTVAFWPALGLSLLGLGLTQSRGALLAAVVGVAVLGWLGRQLVVRAVTMAATVVAIGALAFILVSVGIRWTGGDVPLPSSGLLSGGTLTSRVDYWIGAAEIVARHPLLGTGPDSFSLAYPPVARASDHRIEAHDEVDAAGHHVAVGAVVLASSPHNIFFERAVGAGLAGLAAYLVVVALAFATAIRFVRRRSAADKRADERADERAEPPALVELAAAFAAVLAAYLAQGLVSIDIAPMALVGWVALGAIAALADPGAVSARAARAGRSARARSRGVGVPQRLPGPGALVAVGAVLTVALIAMVLATWPLRADHQAAAAASSSATALGPLEARLDAAIALDPFETDLDNRAASVGLARTRSGTPDDQRAAAAAALRQVDHGLDRAPGDTELLTTRAAILRRQGELGDLAAFAESDATFADLNARDRFGPDSAVLWARMLVAWWKASNDPALKSRATAQAEQAETRLQDWAAGWYTVALVWNDLGDHDRALAAVTRALELQPDDPAAIQLRQQLG